MLKAPTTEDCGVNGRVLSDDTATVIAMQMQATRD
jgi:hypothetical protein